ncbi:copper-binding protein [Thioclava sp. NG1]|uniref:copper chaperone PCu(A)C n=1 Tax=Thioclava sp. NG1 TaxID=2182426 RepID=UPI000D613ACC|nr:copper-binding protein [Thioclava sp. NG1]
MIRKYLMSAALIAVALPAFAADQIQIIDPYVRVSTPMSKSAAAFMEIKNISDLDDRLVSVSSNVAARVELHTHKQGPNGAMQMLEVKEGFEVPAKGEHVLQRGGDHVMFMGLKQSLHQGDMVTLNLRFEKTGLMVVDVPVDLSRDQPTETAQDPAPVSTPEISHEVVTHGEPEHTEPTMDKKEGDM